MIAALHFHLRSGRFVLGPSRHFLVVLDACQGNAFDASVRSALPDLERDAYDTDGIGKPAKRR